MLNEASTAAVTLEAVMSPENLRAAWLKPETEPGGRSICPPHPRSDPLASVHFQSGRSLQSMDHRYRRAQCFSLTASCTATY